MARERLVAARTARDRAVEAATTLGCKDRDARLAAARAAKQLFPDVDWDQLVAPSSPRPVEAPPTPSSKALILELEEGEQPGALQGLQRRPRRAAAQAAPRTYSEKSASATDVVQWALDGREGDPEASEGADWPQLCSIVAASERSKPLNRRCAAFVAAPYKATRDGLASLVKSGRARRDLVYESLDSVAARAAAGADVAERCTSLLEANVLIRRLAKADAGVVARTYKVTGASVVELEIGEGGGAADAEDAWVGDFTDIVNAARGSPDAPPTRRQASDAIAGTAPVSSDADRQAIWDDQLQEQAEEEAAAARTDVDDQWSAYLETLKVTKGEIEAVVIGGVDGPAPCRLCNGKGVRVMFKKETPCEWCGGRGYEEE